ncbi:uncharacterized protein LOC114815071 isoform X2 [Ornithorhynchus anatinus]|uniref:uncharacterized protein LOC114815071 isoform X2 n=1 Tax=Ornithorhynchus anatinus TaxID=9258 RepID=UPI0010A8E9EB|nr:uncharacterized protein LOC114815071 isoform X2 [Ornithorhynchus anatinus]
MRPGPWVPPCPSQPCSSSVLGWLPNPPPVFRRPPPSGILSCVCHSTAADTDTHLSPATRSGPAQPPVTRIPTHPLSVNPQPQVQHPPLQAQGGSVDSEGLRGIWGESWKISRSPNPAPSSQGLLSASFCNLRGPVPQQSSQSRSCLLPEAGSGFRTRLLEVVMGLEGSQPSAPGESKVQWICALEQQPRCNWAVETSTIRVGRVRTSGTVPFPSSSGVLGG